MFILTRIHIPDSAIFVLSCNQIFYTTFQQSFCDDLINVQVVIQNEIYFIQANSKNCGPPPGNNFDLWLTYQRFCAFHAFLSKLSKTEDYFTAKLDRLQPLDLPKLLFGDELLSQAANKLLMISVQYYTHASGRFL